MSDSVLLGGKSAFLVFILVLIAGVVESQLAQASSALWIEPDIRNLTPRQYVQATLKYRQPYFLLYVPVSSVDNKSRAFDIAAT